MYLQPFHLQGPISNNAFSFDKRQNPQLYVPSVIEGKLDDVQIGNQVVFEDFDHDPVGTQYLVSCIGLKNLVKLPHPQTKKPMVVVDNHNHVFYFWYAAWHQGKIDRGINLVHIDAHRDTRIPERMLSHEEAKDLQKVFDYTNSVLNVGNYIPPAMEEGLIGKLISITSEKEMADVRARLNAPLHQPSFILNIDLDFWAPEMDYIDEDWSIGTVKDWMLKADLITFATSPFFIEQERAIEILNKLIAKN